MSKKGIMICGHGSRDEVAALEFSRIATGLQQHFPDMPIEYGFLEFSAPNIHMGLERLLEQGVDNIYVVPGMLFAATHAKNDIPSVLSSFQENHPDICIEYGQELGLHPAMIAAFQARIAEVIDVDSNLYDTMLTVVGRGTSDTEANAEVAKLTRILNENIGFGWADTVYSGVTYPSVGVGLEQLIKLGFKRIVIAPYFLFSGRLIKRIQAYIQQVAAAHPEIEFIQVPYLNDHPKVIEAFAIRIQEIIEPEVEENLMGSFKRRLAAGEVELHHHHAEYRDETEEAPHDHTHEHSHSHGHHHHGVYQHIAHPLGPRTMIADNLCCCFMSQFPEEVLAQEKEQLALLKEKSNKAPQAH